MLVIPVYMYKNEELHDLVIFGVLLAVAAMIMCLAFVTVDIGRPERFLHMIPGIGKLNFPKSMLAWDVVALNGYLLLNVYICGYLIYSRYNNRKPAKWFYIPFIFISIFWAVGIHSVTAFLYVGLCGRPFWNSAIVGPRFIASAFTSGPAIIILALQVIRRVTTYQVPNKALFTLRSIVQVAMVVNVFLLLNEVFKEFYTGDLHDASSRYLFLGLHGHHGLVPWIWTAVALNVTALFLLVLPASRSLRWLDLACVLSIVGIWIEKGMGLIVPGFIPSPIGEVTEYFPTFVEWLMTLGIWAFGFFILTILLKGAIGILLGDIRVGASPAVAAQ
jgi:molybdopterin-containing oxidoreductase family membrane subunit